MTTTRTKQPPLSRIPEVVLIEPHPGQQVIIDGLKRFTVARMGRRFGKTAVALRFLFDVAPRGICAGYRTAWFAATAKIMEDAWLDAKESFGEITIAKNETLKRLTFINRTTLEFWSLESESVARSRHYGAVVIDEAAHATKLETQWPRQIRPTLLQDVGWALFASTPNGKNYFHELDQRSKTRKNWASFHAPSWANPYLLPSEIEDARLDSTALVFLQEYGAEYVSFEGAIVRPEHLQTGSPTDTLDIVLGVDLAISTKTTADFTAIVAMSRNSIDGSIYVRGALRFRGSFNEILRQIAMAAARWNAALIVVEDVQFQAAVVQELLRTTMLPVIGYKPGDKDKLTRFLPVAARYEQRLIFHDENLPAEFVDEVLSFTGEQTGHDDFVDAETMAYHGLGMMGVQIASAGARESQEQQHASYMEGIQ